MGWLDPKTRILAAHHAGQNASGLGYFFSELPSDLQRSLVPVVTVRDQKWAGSRDSAESVTGLRVHYSPRCMCDAVLGLGPVVRLGVRRNAVQRREKLSCLVACGEEDG